jgi:transcriptional regulator with XRE-family HTH domain
MESTIHKEVIIRLRKQLHISQAKLGQAVDLSQSTVSAWESGYTELPDATVAEMGSFLIEQQQRIAALNFPKFTHAEEVSA